MKPKTMILLVVAVACGLGASYMTSKLLAERGKQQDTEPTVPVLVAKGRVASWEQIKEPEKLFEIKQFPQSVAPRKAISDFTELKDHRLNKQLNEGMPLTQNDLLSKTQESLADQLKNGARAVAIKVNAESLVGGFVLPGTHVDVICTVRGNDPHAKVILQHVRVLAVDTQDQRNMETKSIIGQTVTLAVTSDEAARLALAQSIGELRLSLKGQGDTKRTSRVSITMKDLDRSTDSSTGKDDAEPLRPAPRVVVETPLPPVKPVTPPAPPVAVAETKPAPKVEKPHVMTIFNGASKEKVVFSKEEDVDTPPTRRDTDEPAKKPAVPGSRPR